jgi:hypothetical protein
MTTQNLFSVLLLTLLLAVIGVTQKQCSENKTLLEDIEKLRDFESEAQFYKTKNGELIAYNNTITVSMEALRRERSQLVSQIENMRIKNPQMVVTTTTTTRIDSVFIPFSEEIPCDDFMTEFKHKDSIWFVIQGRVSQDGVFVDNVVIDNQTLWVLGTKRNGLFRRNETIVAITNTNPYVNVNTIEPIIIRQKPAFYDRLWFKGLIFVGGVAAGVAISR